MQKENIKSKKWLLCVSIGLAITIIFSSLTLFLIKLKNNYNIDYSQLTYVAMGDSITYGVCKGVKIEKPYVTLVGEDLGIGKVINAGRGGYSYVVGGAYGSIYSERVFLNADTDIISVMAGVNDWGQGLPLGQKGDKTNTTIYGAIYMLNKYFKDTCPNAFVFFMTVLPVASYKQNIDEAYSIANVNNAIKEVCADFFVPVLDTNALANFESEMEDINSTDGTHPSANFHKNNLTPIISNFIKDNYKK